MSSPSSLDIAANRAARKYTPAEMARRVLWMAGQRLFRLSPRPAFGFRARLLRLFGARLGRDVHIYNSAVIYFPWNLTMGDYGAIGEDALVYNLGPVTLGTRVTVSQRAHLCAGTHDYADPAMPLEKPPIAVGDQAWICADAFVGPGVTVGAGAVVGARAVAVKDVPPWTVVAGNPARPVRARPHPDAAAS
jgi:putative colanic acid biosynthesis acetyltransferase WcaF